MRLARNLMTVALLASWCAFPQGGVLGRKTADGKIQFQAVEAIQINGSRQIRLAPAGTRQITPADAKRYPKVALGQVGAIRADASQQLVRMDNEGKPGEIVLPE